MCHECGYTCEKPNPLKIHLALNCGRSPRAELWSRLAAMDNGDGRKIEASFRFSLAPATRSGTPRRLSSAAESAFRPYSPESSTTCSSGGGGPASMSPPRPRAPLPPLRPLASSDDHRKSPMEGPVRHDDGSTFFDRRCAEMETIVSNLGHSDQGHLCIYCGKVYSRKYGLKIHIRYVRATIFLLVLENRNSEYPARYLRINSTGRF